MHLNEIREGALLSCVPSAHLELDRRVVVVLSTGIAHHDGYAPGRVWVLDGGAVRWVFPDELEPYDEEEIPPS